jgi:hypothetical protein
MKTATIDEYKPYGTNHFAMYITYRGNVVFDEVVHNMLKDDLKERAKAVLIHNGFTHWKEPNTKTNYDISKGIYK